MARLALLAISVWLLACSDEKIPSVAINRQSAYVKTTKGITYVDAKVFNGVLVALSKTGDTLSRESFLNGREHGLWKKFYENGQPMETRSFAHGKKVGKYLAWWPNGNQKLEYHFSAGEYHGILREWDVDGHLIRVATYENGYEAGAQKVWYPNGKIRSNYVVINGRRFGLLGTKNCVNASDSVFRNL
jgi:antitoxin component YwqK of YwqJK toxin-antitoxin module